MQLRYELLIVFFQLLKLHNVTTFTYSPEPNPNEYKFVVILEAKTAHSDHRVLFEDSLVDGALRMLGGIRGTSGQYVPTHVSGFKESTAKIECDPVFYEKLHAKSEEILNLLADKEKLAENPSFTWVYLNSLNIIRSSPTWQACSSYVDSLVTAKGSTTVQDITQCPYSKADPRYDENPCCSRISAWDAACVATPANVSVAKV